MSPGLRVEIHLVIDLASIDVSVFADHVGSRFRIEIAPDEFVDAELVEAEARGGALAPDQRQPFSLLFSTGKDLPQQTYRVVHDEMGELHVFMTPVGPASMECVFN